MGQNAAPKPSYNATQDGCVPLQLDLRVVRPLRPCDLTRVATLPSLGSACAFAETESGLQPKTIAVECGIDAPTWSRIKSGEANPSGDVLVRLMAVTGCEAPLLWLLLRRNYDPASLRILQTEVERQIAAKDARIAELEAEGRAAEAMLRRVLTGQAHA